MACSYELILKSNKQLKIALIQLAVSQCKETNVQRACKFITEAAEKGARLICLPECFNAPYGVQYFHQYAESIPGYTTDALCGTAKENKVYLIGDIFRHKEGDNVKISPSVEGFLHKIGSIPEKAEEKLFNTSVAYGPNGEMIAKYRKVHLFDIDITGKIAFKESDALCPGNYFTTFEMGDLTVGLGICYDLRFSLMASIYAQKGCHLLVYPGAFNMTTGPAHWELLQRARAVDNQLYVATVSPARDEAASYVAWGHSTVVDPWGSVIAKAEHKEEILYAEIDKSYVEEVRQQVPVTKQKRDDLYKLVYTEKN